MAARASIVGACETSVGKVREHNEDSHFLDVSRGIFAVCDGMGGHAAGEVASALAVRVVREHWSSTNVEDVSDDWLDLGTAEARKRLLTIVQEGVVAAHDAIVGEAQRDKSKHGMGTTIVGALVVGGDIVFAQCGDSRAYLVRDNIAMQLTEDHTLLARLLAAGVDVDTSNEGARFKSMLTNALGIGQECKVATFIVPVATGDRFLLCSDGVTEYVQEVEIGEVLSQQPSPARAAQKLVELALARGGADNATALVVKVVEAGETARPLAQLQADEKVIASCPLWAKSSPQGRLRGLRIALPREFGVEDRIPAQTLGDRVAWIIVEGEVELEHGAVMGPGGLLYPEALAPSKPLPDKHGLGVVIKDVRALALRADDFRELCADDTELGEQLAESLGVILGDRSKPESESSRAETIGGAVVDAASSDEGHVRNTELGMAVAATQAVPTIVSDKPEVSAPRTRHNSNDPGMAATLPPLPHTPAPSLPRTVSPPRKPVSESGPTLPDGRANVAKATIERAPTPPLGFAMRAAATKSVDNELARGPTDPHVAIPEPMIPRTSTEKRPALQRPPGQPTPERARSPMPTDLIVPKAARAEADAQIDEVFADLTDDKPRASKPRIEPAVEAAGADDEAPTEITIEADAPPMPTYAPPRTSTRHTRPTMRIDDDEPEISIERFVEIEVDTPMSDPDSQPEIVVIHGSRPITANDTKHVAGTIETPKRSS
ncbi:MAG TPA: protein phosphatase 2C domain-containing protein [Kofleriaceae bacterium]|nr:protein phosphatase 2C domain-containing protein [Kofleriaceae bacterium]